MKILIIDDDPVSAKLLGSYLKMYGECHVAESGEEGLEAITHAMQNNAPYELVTLDIMMPVSDGHETLQKIRDLERSPLNGSGKAAVIFMVSAIADISTVMKSFEKLCDAYLTKPVVRRELFDQLLKLGVISMK